MNLLVPGFQALRRVLALSRMFLLPETLGGDCGAVAQEPSEAVEPPDADDGEAAEGVLEAAGVLEGVGEGLVEGLVDGVWTGAGFLFCTGREVEAGVVPVPSVIVHAEGQAMSPFPFPAG